MIGVVVDGPMSEDRVGFLRGEQLSKDSVVRGIEHGLAINLAGENGACFQYFTGPGRLDDTRKWSLIGGSLESLSLAAIPATRNTDAAEPSPALPHEATM